MLSVTHTRTTNNSSTFSGSDYSDSPDRSGAESSADVALLIASQAAGPDEFNWNNVMHSWRGGGTSGRNINNNSVFFRLVSNEVYAPKCREMGERAEAAL